VAPRLHPGVGCVPEWTTPKRADAVLAHAAHEAALDRQDVAATAYARLMKLTGGPGHSRFADLALTVAVCVLLVLAAAAPEAVRR
jgi:hypothetical protein